MLGRKNRAQMDLFITGSLETVDSRGSYIGPCEPRSGPGVAARGGGGLLLRGQRPSGGRPGSAVRLMPAGLLLGIVHDRRLLREAQVNIAIRWFIGYGLEDRLPDHSSLTRSRRRWGGMKASITLEEYKDWGSYAAWRALNIEGCLLPRRAPATGKLNARQAPLPAGVPGLLVKRARIRGIHQAQRLFRLAPRERRRYPTGTRIGFRPGAGSPTPSDTDRNPPTCAIV